MKLLDTFPAFERYWSRAQKYPIPEQIVGWEREYMAPWPELLTKQKDNYRKSGVSWQRIARTRIFPRIPKRIERLRRLHANLLRRLPGAWARTRKALNVDFDVQFVIYVGLGCGAGWATRFGGQPAVLFGLENAAEMTDARGGEWPGAVSHEVAHLVQDTWRARAGRPGLHDLRGPYAQLYAEGFATECERIIEKPSVFRLRTGRSDWLPWCYRHRADLARNFLKDVRAHKSVRKYFGSWYNVLGYSETGYFLGAEVIRELKREHSVLEIALWTQPQVRENASSILRSLATATF